MSTHWWNRSPREQKRIRRWAREPLATNLQRAAQLRLLRARKAEKRRHILRHVDDCLTCQGNQQLMRGKQQPDGKMAWWTIPCPACSR